MTPAAQSEEVSQGRAASQDLGLPEHGRSLLRQVAARAAAMAVLASAAALIPLSQYTDAMAIVADSPISLQQATDDTGPVPALLTWKPLTYRIVTALGGMPLAGALGLYLAIAACGGYILLRTINPTFRVTTGVDWDRWLFFKTYMHTAPLIKGLVTLVPVLVAVYLLWLALAALMPGEITTSVLAAALTGAAVWLALSRNGFVGECDSGSYLLPDLRATGSLLFRGGLYGTMLWLLLYSLLAMSPEVLLRLVRSLGGIGETTWRPAALLWLGGSALAGAIAGLGAVGLGDPGLSARRRLAPGLAAWALALAMVAGVQNALPQVLAARYDYDLATGRAIEAKWWRTRNAAQAVILGVPNRGGWQLRPVAREGISGVPLDEKSLSRVRRHLQERRYRTALAGSGLAALYDGASRNLDPAQRLRVAGDAVRHTGDTTFAEVLMRDLGALAGSEAAARATQALDDPQVFAYLTDDSHLPAGDLCARNNRIADAKRYYRLAGLPDSRAEERAARLVAFSGGTVRGRLAGLPSGVHAKAGVVPLASAMPDLWRLGSGQALAPFALRDVVRSAEVDRAGRFAVERVLEGDYHLVLWFETDRADDLRGMTIASEDEARDVMRIGADTPNVDLGVITLKASSPAAAASGR